MFDYFHKNRDLTRIAFATAFAAPGEVPPDLRYLDRCQRNFEFIRSLIKQAPGGGELDDRFDSRELAYGFYGQAHLYIASHLLMPDYRLNRRAAERIVDLFLAGAGAKKRTELKLSSENQLKNHETKNLYRRRHRAGGRSGGLAGSKALQIQTLIAAGTVVCPAAGNHFRPPWRARKTGRTRSRPSAPSPPCRA